MKIRVIIDGVFLDGFAWTPSERRAFERTFGCVLQDAITMRAGRSAGEFSARNAAFESL
jgi:hypothetical protein